MIASLYRLGRDLRESRAAAGALTQQCLERLTATDHRLGAYRLATGEIARDAAAAADAAFSCGADPGPLAGIPVSIKDLYGMRGLDSYAGSPRPVPPPWQAEGPLVRLLRDQLAVPVGKTHTVEFAFGGPGVNSHWGRR
ncbi:MAG: amidase family protein [Gammaproteobacteria bacterium]|nr:amidase family protein [Gammaproteobacteria bacterium]